MRRVDLEPLSESRMPSPAPPVPIVPAPVTLAWASAVGNQQVQRIAQEYAEQETEESAYEPIRWLPGLDAAEAATPGELDERTDETGPVLARQRSPTMSRRGKGRAPTAQDVADVERVAARIKKELPKLERERAMTTLEAEEIDKAITWFVKRAKERRPGEQNTIRQDLNGLRKVPDQARKRAAQDRSSNKGKSLISDFKVTPPEIRVGEGEAARISFVLDDKVKSVQANIINHVSDRDTYIKDFAVKPTPGFHQAMWDGTFPGIANKPPKTGTYRLDVTVSDGDKLKERVTELIRVENPADETVLPRVGSGLEISTLFFDGKTFVLSDTSSGSIEVPATSGMKLNNPRNTEKKDFTDPKHQWVSNRGPIPSGTYTVKPGHYQVPDADKKGTTYASQGTAAKWGPMRVQIEPNQVKNRSEFFIHMDVTNDGTAGCIGIPTGHEGKFNQIMSLIATSKKDIKLIVVYP
jgi:hypothetical protein